MTPWSSRSPGDQGVAHNRLFQGANWLPRLVARPQASFLNLSLLAKGPLGCSRLDPRPFCARPPSQETGAPGLTGVPRPLCCLRGILEYVRPCVSHLVPPHPQPWASPTLDDLRFPSPNYISFGAGRSPPAARTPEYGDGHRFPVHTPAPLLNTIMPLES